MEYFDTIIIGSGPAGYTAALYLSRAQVRTLVLEGSSYGGALMGTTEVENFPGFDEGIDGPDLMEKMRRQAERFGAQLVPADVTAIDHDGTEKMVIANGVTYACSAIIMATGSVARKLGLANEVELTGRGVSSCATCDGFFFREKQVIVVGGGDSAMEEALFLTRFASRVHLVHRSDNFRASPIMFDRVRNNPKISIRVNTGISALHGGDRLESADLINHGTGVVSNLVVDGLFVAIGHDPQSALLTEANGANPTQLDAQGYVLVEGRSSLTSTPGVFACGDLIDPTYRQAITAAASGCVAALDVQHHLAAQAEQTAARELASH